MRGAVFEATLLLAAGLVVAAQALCKPGHSWWNSEKESCINCTRCDILNPPLMVLRPCQLHQDALCAPLKDLDIDWSWLANYRNDFKHKHRKEIAKTRHEQSEVQSENAKKHNRKITWRFSSSKEQTPDHVDEKQGNKIKSEIQVTNNENVDVVEENKGLSYYDETPVDYPDYYFDYDVKKSEPSEVESDDEWDLQTILLVVAASLCVLFFILVAIYSVHYTKQWKVIKKNLEADVEGLTAKLNLMMEEAESQECPSPLPQYSNVRCAYLEQLLVGKNNENGPGPGNLYIQENNT